MRDAVFETCVGLAAQPWLGDHRLFDRPVFPATGYVTSALGAALAAGADLPIAVENLAISVPLATPPGKTHVAQSALAAERSGEWRFQFFSQPDTSGPGDPWTLHATAGVRKMQPDSSVPSIDLAGLRARCPRSVDATEHYAGQRERGLLFGPAFQGLVALYRGRDEAVGEARLPDVLEKDAASAWHPAFLDCALQTVVQAAGDRYGDAGILVPVAIERLTFYAKAPSTVWTHAYVQPAAGGGLRAEVKLYGGDGRLVADIAGLLIQHLDERRLFGQAESDSTAGWLFGVEWRRQPRRGAFTRATRPRSWIILADDGGTGDALRDAVASHGDTAVIVRRGDAFVRHQDGHYDVSPGSSADLRRVLALIRSDTEDVSGIVDLWPLDARVEPDASASDLDHAQALACGTVLALVQAVAGAAIADQPPRLWIVTRGTQPVGRLEPAALPQSLVWGLGRTIALEHPELGVDPRRSGS